MTKLELQELRDTLAKYMRLRIQGITKRYYFLHGERMCRVSDWKPDNIHEHAAMVEDKLPIKRIVYSWTKQGGWLVYYELKRGNTIPKGVDKIKKVARALALEAACKKAMK